MALWSILATQVSIFLPISYRVIYSIIHFCMHYSDWRQCILRYLNSYCVCKDTRAKLFTHHVTLNIAYYFDSVSVKQRLMWIYDLKVKAKSMLKSEEHQLIRQLEFIPFSNPPRLMKITRNCWLSKVRSLWVCFTCTTMSDNSIFYLHMQFTFAEQWTGHLMVPHCISAWEWCWMRNRTHNGI